MTWTILNADARHIPLANKSVQCVVTSPPYWGLRDYGTATWVGGDEGCDHIKSRTLTSLANSTLGVSKGQSSYDAAMRRQMNCFEPFSEVCGKCGATRIDSQIGLEKTPQEYVAKIVAVFREVWRVLRDDGTCWVNLGDSYAGGNRNRGSGGKGPSSAKQLTNQGGYFDSPTDGFVPAGLKPKDLVGIPWRIAFALQADGWYLRSDIIWAKPNPMPESVTDRPTKAHEYIFLLTKKERYFFDQDAVREAHVREWDPSTNGGSMATDRHHLAHIGGSNRQTRPYPIPNEAGRNIRTVWEIATQPYPEAHFATFPEEIAIRCIKAGTSEKGACKECGAPWVRVTEANNIGKISYNEWRSQQDKGRWKDGGFSQKPGAEAKGGSSMQQYYRDVFGMESPPSPKTIGWQPTCKHEAPTVPCIVLDPFSGAGTVALVADKLNRRGIGLELKADYCRMASRRCYDDAPLLVGI